MTIMVSRFIVAITCFLIFGSALAQPVTEETYLRYATEREFDGLYIAHVVTSLRGEELKRNLADRLIALCSSNDYLDKYSIFVYSDPESADFQKNNIGTIPDMGDEQWQRVDEAILATYYPSDGTLTIRSRESDSEIQIQIGKSWCKSP
ncbi:MAG: hypothetical protein LBB55_02270 [Zoogloeaceae bacterium]|jgi:uncharacterized protein YrzB (UPF0473 family)|nr:hypothetical protein [Zoogloeaceae bacterium]